MTGERRAWDWGGLKHRVWRFGDGSGLGIAVGSKQGTHHRLPFTIGWLIKCHWNTPCRCSNAQISCAPMSSNGTSRRQKQQPLLATHGPPQVPFLWSVTRDPHLPHSNLQKPRLAKKPGRGKGRCFVVPYRAWEKGKCGMRPLGLGISIKNTMNYIKTVEP